MKSFLVIVTLAACGSKPPTPETPHDHTTPVTGSATETPAPDAEPRLLAAETAAWEKAKPVFVKYCSSCHTKAGNKTAKKKLDHFDMDSYPLGGHHRATIGFEVREVLGLSGKKPTMPSDKPGSVQGDELATIQAWTDAWEAADKAGAHGAVHHADHDDHDADHDDDHDHDD